MYMANNMQPDQTAPGYNIVFHSLIKSSLKSFEYICSRIRTDGQRHAIISLFYQILHMKTRQYFQDTVTLAR